MNTFGRHFRLTTFGESHGAAIGGIVDGMPAGLTVDSAAIALAMERRRPSRAAGGTTRHEEDAVELLSGIYNGLTTGAPIGFIIPNKDARSADYAELADKYRPNHADYTWSAKYGIRDPRGGGRASARETACRVAGGALADMLLRSHDIKVVAWASRIGEIEFEGTPTDENAPFDFATRCPDAAADAAMRELTARTAAEHDTLGGIVSCAIYNLPAGLGEPLAAKFQAELAGAMMSIPAARGFEYGDGFAAATSRGSLQTDEYCISGGRVATRTNHSGGIQGGITNGMPVLFRVAFKPIATMPGRTLQTVDATGRECSITARGRHDVCAVPRAVAVVQAMARLTVADALLAKRVSK